MFKIGSKEITFNNYIGTDEVDEVGNVNNNHINNLIIEKGLVVITDNIYYDNEILDSNINGSFDNYTMGQFVKELLCNDDDDIFQLFKIIYKTRWYYIAWTYDNDDVDILKVEVIFKCENDYSKEIDYYYYKSHINIHIDRMIITALNIDLEDSDSESDSDDDRPLIIYTDDSDSDDDRPLITYTDDESSLDDEDDEDDEDEPKRDTDDIESDSD